MDFIIVPCRDEPNINKFLSQVFSIMDKHVGVGRYYVIVATGDKETLHNLKLRTGMLVFKTFGDSLERSILNGISMTYDYEHDDCRILVMDSDSSHPVSMIPEMLNKLSLADMVVGTRFHEKNRNMWRRIVTKGFSIIAMNAGSELTDPMSGFFAFNRSILDGMKFKPIKWKVCLEIELYHRINKKPPKIIEVPIDFYDRDIGKTKSNYKVAFALAKDLMMYR